MSDKPRLYVQDKTIVSPSEAREEEQAIKQGKYDENGKRRPKGQEGDFATRGEVAELIRDTMTAAAGRVGLAVGQKMYDQVSGELAENFEEQERRLIAVIASEFERRTLRGRLRQLGIRLGFVAPVQLARVVDPVEAMDPNLAAMEAEEDAALARELEAAPAPVADDVLHVHAP